MIFLIAFLDMLGFGLILPQLPFFAQQFNAGPVEIGILASSFPFFQLLTSGFWGAASDRYGAKPVLLCGLAGSVVAYLIFGAAGSYAALIVSRSLAGVCAGNLGVIRALLACPEDPARNQKNMAWFGAVQGLGFLFGPLICVGLMYLYPDQFGAPGFAAAVFSFVSLALVASVRIPSSQAHRVKMAESAAVLKDFKIRRALIASYLHQFSFALFFIALPLLMQSRFPEPARLTAIGFMLLALIAGLAQGLIAPRFLRKFGALRCWMIFAPLAALFSLGFPVAENELAMVLVLCLWGFSFAMTNPPLFSWVGLLSTEGYKGVIAGAAESMAGLARISGNLVSGILIAYLGNGGPFVISAAVMTAAFILGRQTGKNLESHS